MANKLTKYRLLRHTPDKLTKVVMTYVKNGYVPLGSPVKDPEWTSQLIQAVVKYEEVVND